MLRSKIRSIISELTQLWLATVFSVTIFSLVTVVDDMVLGSVGCPAKVYCTAVFALQNGKF